MNNKNKTRIKTNQKRDKPMLSVTIDRDLLETFKFCSKKHSINKSNLIENFLMGWLKEVEPAVFKQYKSTLKKLDFVKRRT